MKRIWVLIFILIFTLPAVAQSIDYDIYEFDTGTTLDYPLGWSTEINNGVLAITGDNPSQILVLDYPLVASLSDYEEPVTLTDAVEAMTNILLETSIDRDAIYQFKIGTRTIAAYDINLALTGSVFAVEFTNGGIGMLVTIEIDEDVESDMLESFDSIEDRIESTSLALSAGGVRDVPTIFLFDTNQRFMVPSGWELSPLQVDEVQYALLSVPDEDVFVQLLDLSDTVTKGTELQDVLDTAALNWEGDFGFAIDGNASPYHFSDRESISYDVRVDGEDGLLIVLRFSNDAIGLAVIYGEDVANYEQQINQIIGSFNNLGAVLDHLF